MNTAVLEIDSSEQDTVSVFLSVGGRRIEEKKTRGSLSQELLPLIGALLRKHNLSVSSISSMKLHTGPGSFTGLRVGAAVANCLGWLLSVPLNNEKPGEPVYPDYENKADTR